MKSNLEHKTFLSLKKKQTFQYVYRNSYKISGSFCSAYFVISSQNYYSIGIIVLKKVGNAVKRNRIKRIIRAFFRNKKYTHSFFLILKIYKPIPSELDLYTELDRIHTWILPHQ